MKKIYLLTNLIYAELHDKSANGVNFSDGSKLNWRVKLFEGNSERLKQLNMASTNDIIVVGEFDLPEHVTYSEVVKNLENEGFENDHDWFSNMWSEDVENVLNKLK